MGIARKASGAKIGQISAFPRTTAPSGWLKANGAAVSRTVYAALFLEIGTTYGVGDGVTTFNLPEVRGEFIRGLDDGRGVDPSRTLATAQLDALQQHRHGTNDGGVSGDAGNYGVYAGNGSVAGQGDVHSNYRTATETRPRNRAFLMCIKY